MGFKPFTPQGEAPDFEFPSACGSPCREGVYHKTGSQASLLASMGGFIYLLFFGCTVNKWDLRSLTRD